MTRNYDMDSLPVTDYDRVMECVGEALSEFHATMADFPQDITNAFVTAAQRLMAEAASPQDSNDRLAQLMVSSFVAGRLHGQRGYPSPIERSVETDFEIPDDLRPPTT